PAVVVDPGIGPVEDEDHTGRRAGDADVQDVLVMVRGLRERLTAEDTVVQDRALDLGVDGLDLLQLVRAADGADRFLDDGPRLLLVPGRTVRGEEQSHRQRRRQQLHHERPPHVSAPGPWSGGRSLWNRLHYNSVAPETTRRTVE